LIVRAKGTANIGTFGPRESEPFQVLNHGRFEIEPEANRVQVVVSQNQCAVGRTRTLLRDPKSAGMPEMK
jgi:hypothetical protein